MLNGCDLEIKKYDFFEPILGQYTLRKALNGLSPEQFMQYFKHYHHEKGTIGSNPALALTLNKTKSGKRTFVSQRAKLFNNLPRKVWDKRSLVLFKHKLKYVAKTL